MGSNSSDEFFKCKFVESDLELFQRPVRSKRGVSLSKMDKQVILSELFGLFEELDGNLTSFSNFFFFEGSCHLSEYSSKN